MDGFPPSGEASKGVSAEAARPASMHDHDGGCFDGNPARETGTVIPFARAALANAPPSAAVPSAAPLILMAPPTITPVADYARKVVAGVVARGAKDKNVPLTPAEADTVVNAVLAALDLADLYRFAMGEPGAVRKAAQLIGDKLDEAALLRLMLFVLAVEDKENAHDPSVVEIVAAIAKEIASAATSGPIIWPDIAEAVKKYYGSRPSVVTNELPDGTTITIHLRGGQPHRDEREGAALILHDTETGALRREAYFHEGKLHRDGGPAEIIHHADGIIVASWFRHGILHRDPKDGPAQVYRDDVRSWSEYQVDGVCHRFAREGPAFIFSHWEGRELSGEEYVEHGVRHRPTADGPALRCIDRAGNPVIELWCERGERHRDPKDGPAWRGLEDGCRIKEYYRRGKLHRDEHDGPAVVAHDASTSALRREAYFHEDALHRESGPAETVHHPDGTVTENWYLRGVPHRNGKDGPACVERGPDGTVLYEAWYRHGELHRSPRFGPASTWRDPATGQILEDYYRDGLRHRDPRHGPAMTVRDAGGSILEQEFWVEGAQVEMPATGEVDA